ncbi:thiamine pyrophosphate-binding protein [Halobium salinum]|uniref:Thiamine pyrophosphate-binding protein n=1 Tax=Halobium salinum TaxID=1364940 RepID=A0ABD5PIC8_9EURY|nr:thiamine pyrophosphate-binding protein [Halobium salinum]
MTDADADADTHGNGSDAGRAAKTGGAHVYEALVDAGVDTLVGIPGTQTLPLDRTVVERDEMRYVMARHETAVPHIAWGYYEASGRPAATLTVPGPGDTNAMHGLKNAYEDSVPILHVSADVDPDERGKGPIHEIEPDTYDNAVKANVNVERRRDLPADVARGLETALTPPTGPVRLGVPSGILDAEFAAPAAEVAPEQTSFDNETAYDDAVARLASAERPLLYVGGGARRAEGGPRAVADLADALDAPVVTTYKGKGVFPEDDDRFLGVAGSHLPSGAERVLGSADVVVALGTDFDGVTTAGWSLPMGDALVHVTLDPDAIDASYDTDVAIVDDAADAADRLREGVEEQGLEGRDGSATGDGWDGSRVAREVREEYDDHLRGLGLFDGGSPATTPELLAAVREVTPREASVAVDVGGFRLWAMQTFPAYAPEGFVAAGSWAGMGVGLPAAIGAQLARPDRPALCLTGDGGLLMCIHELHTAAEYDLDITCVVSNNADYGVISKSPKIEGYGDGHQFTWTAPDFATVAEGFGWEAVHVESAAEAGEAVADAMDADGPVLVDVDVETDEPSAAEASAYDSTVALD